MKEKTRALHSAGQPSRWRWRGEVEGPQTQDTQRPQVAPVTQETGRPQAPESSSCWEKMHRQTSLWSAIFESQAR